MILVDTSVLIHYLKGTNNKAVEKLEYILSQKIPFGINSYIYQELLQGVSSDSEFKILKDYLETQNFYELKNGKKSFEDAAKIYIKCRKAGFTIKSTIDMLIVQTSIENDLLLLHDDMDFTNISKIIKELKIFDYTL